MFVLTVLSAQAMSGVRVYLSAQVMPGFMLTALSAQAIPRVRVYLSAQVMPGV